MVKHIIKILSLTLITAFFLLDSMQQQSSPASTLTNVLSTPGLTHQKRHERSSKKPVDYGRFKKRNVNLDPLPTLLVDQVIDNCAEDIKNDILDFIEALNNNFCEDKQISRIVLFVGPPGNGKTTLAQAIAQKAMVPYIFEQASFISTEYVNSGPQYLQDLIGYVNDQQKVYVVILDEVHALLPDPKNASVQAENADPLAAFFDLVNKTKKILVICTANTFDKLSKPTLDRFSSVIEIGELTQEQREEIIRFHLEQNNFDVSEDFIKKFAAESTQLSNRRIEDCIKRAAVARRRLEKSGPLTQEAQENLLNSMKKKLLHIKWLYTENPNARYWQIGTAIIAAIPVIVVTVPPLFRFFQRYFPSETEKRTIALAEKAQIDDHSLKSIAQADFKEIEMGKLALGQRTLESGEKMNIARFAHEEKMTAMSNASQERIAQGNNNAQWDSSIIQAGATVFATGIGKAIEATGNVMQENIRSQTAIEVANIANRAASNAANTMATNAPGVASAVTQAAITPAVNVLQSSTPEIVDSAIQTATSSGTSVVIQTVSSHAPALVATPAAAALAIQVAPVVTNMVAPVVVPAVARMAMQVVAPTIAQTAPHVASTAVQSTITPVASMAMQVVVPAATKIATVAAPAVAEATVEAGISLAGSITVGAVGGATVATAAPSTTAAACAVMAPAVPVLLPILATIAIGGAIGGGVYVAYCYWYKK